MKLALSILVFVLVAACQPTSYVVDTRAYTEDIKTNPIITVDPKDVTPVGGGFSAVDFSGEIATDFGSISTDGKNIHIRVDPVLIDARSGK